MAEAVDNNKNEERRKRVFVGKLPPDFLRLTTSEKLSAQEQQEAADAQAALALQQSMMPNFNNLKGRLKITVIQAKLVKNYGISRMDPYVRLRIGHNIYETNTDTNAGKNPKWNRCIQCLLPQGVNSIYLEIFDECSFTMDELIAWAHIPIPPNVLKGETYEDWFALSGKQGEDVEGMIYLVISFSPGHYNIYGPPQSVAMNVGKGDYHLQTVPVSYTTPFENPSLITPPAPPVSSPSVEELAQIEEMFPNVEKEVIKSVYEVNKGNKDLTVNSLLQISG